MGGRYPKQWFKSVSELKVRAVRFLLDMSKTGKKKSKKGVEKVNKTVKERDIQQAQDEEKTFYFGGLPNRDLKKNLGCG